MVLDTSATRYETSIVVTVILVVVDVLHVAALIVVMSLADPVCSGSLQMQTVTCGVF